MLDVSGPPGDKRALRWQALRSRCPSSVVLALGISLAWALFYNLRFWHEVAAVWGSSLQGVAFMGSLLALIVFLHALILLMIPGRFPMRVVASALFIAAALSAHFIDSYGLLIDTEMIRNVFETDKVEVSGLIDSSLLAYLTFLGILPAILIWRIELPARRWPLEVRDRLVFAVVGLVVCAASTLALSPAYAVFLREHKPVRYLISPGAVLVSTVSYAAQSSARPLVQPLVNPGGPIRHVRAPFNRPLLVFLVVGETARAANFQLGGYGRATNPELSAASDLVYFDDAVSCGTSTSISVPCIFSHLGREAFDKSDSSRYLNLLDMLAQAGIDVEWRDNNAGCKGVCARVPSVEYSRNTSDLCEHGYCFDEVLMSGLHERLSSLNRDTLIVFHQIGSHGPAYADRYPARFERFRPVCHTNELDNCSGEEVVNAYDNTIAYTDFNLAEQIRLLQSLSERLDAVLIYVSDHGESLGEQRIYLHGMPYALAPAVQRHVPFLIWTSPGFRQRAKLREACLQAKVHEPVSHDNVFHTVMGAFGLSNSVYRRQLDLFAVCE